MGHEEDAPIDGGPAFPSEGEGFGNPKHHAPGMSLRDWFAGMVAAMPQNEYGLTIEDVDLRAQEAYRIADALIKARGAKP